MLLSLPEMVATAAFVSATAAAADIRCDKLYEEAEEAAIRR